MTGFTHGFGVDARRDERVAVFVEFARRDRERGFRLNAEALLMRAWSRVRPAG